MAMSDDENSEPHGTKPTRPLDDDLLRCLPVFPLPAGTMFPGAVLPLHLFEPRYRALAEYCVRGPRAMAVAGLVPGHQEEYFGSPPVYPVMGVGALIAQRRLPDGRWNIALRGIGRVRLVRELDAEGELFRLARAEALVDGPPSEPDVALAATLRQLLLQVAQKVPAGKQRLEDLLAPRTLPGILADMAAHGFVADAGLRQELIEELGVTRRLERVIDAVGSLLLELS